MNGFDWHKTLWRLFEGTVLIGLGLAVHAANHEAKVPFVGIPVCDVLLGGGAILLGRHAIKQGIVMAQSIKAGKK